MAENSFEIRLSRIPLAVLFVAGCFFLFAGLDIGFFHSVFPNIGVNPDKKWIFYLFLLFFVGCGGAIAVQMLLYLINPPVMFRASPEGIAFGTGFRYRLHTIHWKYIESIHGGADLAAAGDLKIGLQVQFKNTNEIEGALPTSIGVVYQAYILTLSRMYMGTSVSETAGILNTMWKKYR